MSIARIRRTLSRLRPLPTMEPASDTTSVGMVKIGSDAFQTEAIGTPDRTKLKFRFCLIVDATMLREPVLVVDGDPNDMRGSLREAVAQLRHKRRGYAADWRESLRCQVLHEASKGFHPSTLVVDDLWDTIVVDVRDDREAQLEAAKELLARCFRYVYILTNGVRISTWYAQEWTGPDDSQPVVATAEHFGDATYLAVRFPDGTVLELEDQAAWPLMELGTPAVIERELAEPALR